MHILSPGMSVDFSSLPDDIIHILGKSLNKESPIDSYNLMILSKQTQVLLLPIIYSSVHLRNSRQCFYTLRYLQRCPTVASYVRKLVVSPGGDTHNAVPDSVMEEQFAHTLEQLASSLKQITDLSWDGSCLPKSTTFWWTFQKKCPELGYIRTAISQQEPFSWDRDTDFLRLVNLRGLSVKLKSSPRGLDPLVPPRYLHTFPPPFWEIIRRSPKLQQLNFEGDVLRSFGFEPLLIMKLPSLKTLTINATIFTDDASIDLVTFLNSAPGLKCFDLSSFARVPWDCVQLPRITHYGGNIHSILAGGTHWPSLQSLDVSYFPVSFGTATRLFERAPTLPSLTSLKLRLTFEDPVVMQGNSNFFGEGDAKLGLLPTLACRYPNLTDLDMISSTGSTLPWEDMFHSLGDFPHLTNFCHTHVPPRSGGTTLQIATTALLANSNIEQVTIHRSVGPWYQKLDYKISEKVVVRYITRQAMLVSVRHNRYKDDESRVSNSRLLLSNRIG